MILNPMLGMKIGLEIGTGYKEYFKPQPEVNNVGKLWWSLPRVGKRLSEWRSFMGALWCACQVLQSGVGLQIIEL